MPSILWKYGYKIQNQYAIFFPSKNKLILKDLLCHSWNPLRDRSADSRPDCTGSVFSHIHMIGCLKIPRRCCWFRNRFLVFDMIFDSVGRLIGLIVKTTNNIRILNSISSLSNCFGWLYYKQRSAVFMQWIFLFLPWRQCMCELCRYFEREILNRPIQETETKYRLNKFSGVDIVTAELVHVRTHFICLLECFDHIATLMLMLLVIALNCYEFAHII